MAVSVNKGNMFSFVRPMNLYPFFSHLANEIVAVGGMKLTC